MMDSLSFGMESGTSSKNDTAVNPSYRRNSLISFCILIVFFVLMHEPSLIDRPLARWVGSADRERYGLEQIFSAFDTYFMFSGVTLMSLLWACWSDKGDDERRARILLGALVAFGAGVLSRLLQHVLPSHVRPFYDPMVAFHPRGPSVLTPLNAWNSFPSDHATVFAGLVVVLFTIRSRLAIPAALWTALVESARLYTGAHFLTDLLGGAALAATCVWAFQAPPVVALGKRAVGLERSMPSLFYGMAFFLSFQIATLFNDVRGLTGGLRLFNHVQ